MAKKDKSVDAYIKKSAGFANPILNHLRQQIHRGCPDVIETIKWGFPHFEYQGVLCSIAGAGRRGAGQPRLFCTTVDG